MEDYIKRQIDMIGQMLLAICKKLGLVGGNAADFPIQTVQAEIDKSGQKIDINAILANDNPVSFMVETLELSDDAVETFTDIIMHSDASEDTKEQILNDAIRYLDNKGRFSFTLHSYIN